MRMLPCITSARTRVLQIVCTTARLLFCPWLRPRAHAVHINVGSYAFTLLHSSGCTVPEVDAEHDKQVPCSRGLVENADLSSFKLLTPPAVHVHGQGCPQASWWLARPGRHIVRAGRVTFKRTAMTRKRFYGAIVFTGILGASFMIPGFIVRDSGQPHEGGVTTTGHVTGSSLTAEMVSEGYISHPNVTFVTDSGEVVEFTDMSGDSCFASASPANGSEVRVSYRPTDPQDAKNLDGCNSTVGWALIGAGGGFMLLAGMVSCCYWCSSRLPQAPGAAHAQGSSMVELPGTSQLVTEVRSAVHLLIWS